MVQSSTIGTFILDFLACSFLACFSLASFSPAHDHHRSRGTKSEQMLQQKRGKWRRRGEIVLLRSNSYCFFLLARLFFFDIFFPPSPPTAPPRGERRRSDQTLANNNTLGSLFVSLPVRGPSSLLWASAGHYYMGLETLLVFRPSYLSKAHSSSHAASLDDNDVP